MTMGKKKALPRAGKFARARHWRPRRLAALRLLAATAAVVTCAAAVAAPASAAQRGGRAAGVALLPSRGPRVPGTARPCFYQFPDCASSDAAVAWGLRNTSDTSSCMFSGHVTWGDGHATNSTFPGGPAGTTLVTYKHDYATPSPFLQPKDFTITWTLQVTSGSCTASSGTLRFTHTPPDSALSGASWAQKFPPIRSLTALSGNFRRNVARFIGAMQRAGITVHVIATRLGPERAYLMHYSWLIAKGTITPAQVPRFAPRRGQAPVDICWIHTKPDGSYDAAASVAAARKLAAALGAKLSLPAAPGLTSPQTTGLAIEMTTTWTRGVITIVTGTGHSVKIRTTPHSGLNRRLIAVGATYHVIHAINATAYPNYWSFNGH